jgi:hypothetical protein
MRDIHHDAATTGRSPAYTAHPRSMATYEYVVVVRENKTNWSSIQHLPATTRPEQTWTSDYYIWWPDAAEAETRLDKDNSSEWSKICGELGRQGWKLVIAEIPRSSVGSGTNGWTGTVSFPISERWYFERVVSS